MLLPLAEGRRLYYDLTGPEDAPVVCITHSLASDGGSWAEQVPPLLQAGFRVLRLDMRGHGGSDPVAGEYTMKALASDVAAALGALSIPRVHYIGLSIGGMIGQAFAIDHAAKLISAMWCDTLPASPIGAAAMWDERMNTVRRANSLEPLADGTVERWFTDAFKPRNPGRWKQIRDTVAATTPAGYLGCSAAIMNFRFRRPAVILAHPCFGGMRGRRPRYPGQRKPAARRAGFRWPLRGNPEHEAFPQCRAPRRVQPDHAGLAGDAATHELIRARSHPPGSQGQDRGVLGERCIDRSRIPGFFPLCREFRRSSPKTAIRLRKRKRNQCVARKLP